MRPLKSVVLPSSLDQPAVVAVAESVASGVRFSKIVWIVGCLPACSVLVPVGAVEHRRGDERRRRRVRAGLGLGAADRARRRRCSPSTSQPQRARVAEVRLEHLADVHAGRHAERVEDDVDRGAVGQEGHVLDREDLGDDALVAVAAGELVADADLALLGDVDPHQLVDARRQLVALVTAEHLDVDDLAALAVGHLEQVSRTSRAFSPKMARRRRSSGVSSVSPLGVTLPTSTSPGPTSAPTRMMPRSSRSARISSERFGMSRVISSGPSLVSRASISCSWMWIDVSTSSFTRRSDRMMASSKL